jgi:hypothetical protein
MSSEQPEFEVFQEKILDHGSWTILPVEECATEDLKRVAHRLNCLGSSFYFSKVALKNYRLSLHFHLGLCLNTEKEYLKEVIEVPRDHFKSTIYSESFPIWWALPFTQRDENIMRSLGYGDEWIRWMKLAHNQDTRTLLVSENITNAAKLGVRIDGHYANNSFFRYLFDEIVPTTSSGSWSQFSKTHTRSQKSKPHGEGTYDYIGVGGALQSRHYDRVVQDDLVGKKAMESDVEMAKTIDYHKLLVGAFDSVPGAEVDNDEIVVGNRWSFRDLNSYIRENEQYFRFTNHSALGGCCSEHPSGVPLFPEEFTLQKLERFAKRLGPYLFSCQFLNKPIPPKGVAFDPANVRYYSWRRELDSKRIYLSHEVEQGEVLPDIPTSKLQIVMIVDPNHSGKHGRCNHALVVLGVLKDFEKTRIENGVTTNSKQDHIYLLDSWAEAADYDSLVNKIYEFSAKWKLREFWLETIAAQKYLKYHLEYRNKVENRVLKVKELKTPKTENAKDIRIQSMDEIFNNKRFFAKRTDTQFMQEYSLYPNGKTVDILDVVAYGPSVFTELGWSISELQKFYEEQDARPQPVGPCGY